MSILQGSILFITDGKVSTQHLLLYLFLVLNGWIIGEVFVLYCARSLMKTGLASLVAQLKVALSQIHN